MLNFQGSKDTLLNNPSKSYETLGTVREKNNVTVNVETYKGSKHLLIVGANAHFIRNNMVDLNYDCAAFEDTESALSWLEKISKSAHHMPHAIICDLELLEGDAYTLFEEVQKKPKLKHLPFIIMSK